MPAVCGQDWDGSHLIGGQALIRSHGPPNGWVGSTGHYQDSISDDASAGLLGQTSPKMSGG